MNIIELSQTKSGRVIENGHYEVKLPHPITIYPNDSLKIFSSYIDTTANNDNKITIPDTQLKISFGYYWRDWHNVAGLTHTPALTNNIKFTNHDYILSKFTPAGGPIQGCNVLTKIEFTYHKKNYSFGDGTAHFTYEDPGGNTQNLNIYVPLQAPEQAPYIKALNVVMKKNTLKFVNEKDFKKVRVGHQNCVVQKYVYEPVEDKGTYSPVINHKSITLDSGDYDAQDLAQIISEKMTANNGSHFINNNLLEITDSYNPTNHAYLRSDGKAEFKIGTPSSNNHSYLVGSSQFGLEYDNNTNKFSFTYIHTPLYSAEGEIVVKYLYDEGTASPKTYPIAKMGGIFFNALKAYNINDDGSIGDENHLFWEKILGFNIDSICPDLNYFTYNIGGAIDANVFSCDLTPGETTTDGFIGTDSTVNKKGNYWVLEPIDNPTDPNYPFQSSLNSTVPIIAETAYNEAVFQGSHFFIEIDSNFKTELIDEIDTKSKIMSIVNRYYSVNNFTTADSSGSLIYQHISTEPVILSSFIVKILDYNNDLANVGEKNTVFLQLIKAQPEEDLNAPLENKQ